MTLHEYRDVIQRSPEWYQLRCGIVTASTVGRLITAAAPGADAYVCDECNAAPGEPCVSLRGGAPIKTMHGGRLATASARAPFEPPVLTVADNETSRGLIHTLAAERLAGMGEDTPMTSDMWRGVDSEPYAREAYAQHAKVDVVEIGFQVREFDGVKLGYSPDGLVNDDGCIEVKSPRAKTHVATILAGEVPAQHMGQVQAALFVSGRAWCDFVSFSGGLHLFPKRVYPDARWQAVIRDAVLAAEERITDLTERYAKAVDGLPITEPIPDPYDVEVSLS
jgi:hypothetical protein